MNTKRKVIDREFEKAEPIIKSFLQGMETLTVPGAIATAADVYQKVVIEVYLQQEDREGLKYFLEAVNRSVLSLYDRVAEEKSDARTH